MKENLHLPRQSHSVFPHSYLWTCVDNQLHPLTVSWVQTTEKTWQDIERRKERKVRVFVFLVPFPQRSQLAESLGKSNQAALSMWFSMISGSDNYSIHPLSRSTGHERPLRSLALWIRCSLPTTMWIQPADDTHCISSPFISKKWIFRDMRWLFQSHRDSNC